MVQLAPSATLCAMGDAAYVTLVMGFIDCVIAWLGAGSAGEVETGGL